MQETRVRSLDWEDPLEKEMATHSSILAWKIPWTEEPGRLQSMGLKRVRHDWATSLSLSLFFFLATGLVGSYFPIRDHLMPPAVRAWSPDHWAVREFPVSYTCSWFSCSLPPLFFLRIFFLHSTGKTLFLEEYRFIRCHRLTLYSLLFECLNNKGTSVYLLALFPSTTLNFLFQLDVLLVLDSMSFL